MSALATKPPAPTPPNSWRLPLRRLDADGERYTDLYAAFPALRPADLITLMGDAVADTLERRFLRRGRSVVLVERERTGPGEVLLRVWCCWVGVGVLSLGVVGTPRTGEEGGAGVCARGLGCS